MLCMAEKNFQGILFLGQFCIFPKFFTQALAVCQRKGLRPRLSIAPESPQVMAVMLTVGSRGEEVAYLLGRAGRVSDALRTVQSSEILRFMMVHGQTFVDCINHVLLEILQKND